MTASKADLRSLPDELHLHVLRVRKGLANGAAGPVMAEGRESLEALVKALIGARGRAEAALRALSKAP